MAWDGFRLPTFSNVVKYVHWGTVVPDMAGLDLTAVPDLTCQLFWGIKRGFRLPVYWLDVEPGTFPMMIKAPWGTGLTMPNEAGTIFGDWFFWSANGRIWYGVAIQAGPISWGNPNQYEGAVVRVFELNPADAGMPVFPPGWPLP